MASALHLSNPSPAQAQALGRTDIINKTKQGTKDDSSAEFWVACFHESAHYFMAELFGWNPGRIVMHSETSASTYVAPTEAQLAPFRRGWVPTRGGMRTRAGTYQAQSRVIYEDALISLAGPAASYYLEDYNLEGCEGDIHYASARLREISIPYTASYNEAKRLVRVHANTIETRAETLYRRYVRKFAKKHGTVEK